MSHQDIFLVTDYSTNVPILELSLILKLYLQMGENLLYNVVDSSIEGDLYHLI